MEPVSAHRRNGPQDALNVPEPVTGKVVRAKQKISAEKAIAPSRPYRCPIATLLRPGATLSRPGATLSRPGTTLSRPGTTPSVVPSHQGNVVAIRPGGRLVGGQPLRDASANRKGGGHGSEETARL
jgi:hypothetical protein